MSTISNYGSFDPADDGSQTEANKVKFSTVKSSLTNPIKTFVEANLEKAGFSNTRAPSVTDDTGDSFGVGSLWVDTSADLAYICVDASSGAAVWAGIYGKKHNFSATAAPTTTDDTNDSYAVGSLWFDVTNDIAYACVDATAGGAVWKDLTLDINGQTSTASASGANDSVPIYDASASANRKITVDDLCTIRGDISGFIMSNDTDSDHDISIGAGLCRDAGDTTGIRRTAAIVKQIDANWAEGSAAGGFPSGLTLTADTTYHVFVIKKVGGVDAGFDTSLTATNLLTDASDYSEYRRIGSVITDSSSNIIGFQQVGDWFQWEAPANESHSLTSAGADVAITVPSGITVMAFGTSSYNDATAERHVSIQSALTTSTAAASNNAHLKNNTNAPWSSSQWFALTDTSAQIHIRAGANDTGFDFSVYGYQDFRGKD